MARKRYNGQRGITGTASLNGSAGSQAITGLFAIAPNFATLSGGDYVPLVVQPNTASMEVVWLTGYTAGSLDGTITRQAEDSTLHPAVAHAAGSVWDHDVTAYDLDVLAPNGITVQAGRYYRLAVTSDEESAVPTVQDRLLFTPLVLANAGTLTSLSVQVNAGYAGYSVRLGVYADSGFGFPDALLLDAGTVPATAGGVQTISGLSLAIGPGAVWLAVVPQGGAANMYCYTAARDFSDTSLGSMFATRLNFRVAGVTGALPNPVGTLAASGSDVTPIVIPGF